MRKIISTVLFIMFCFSMVITGCGVTAADNTAATASTVDKTSDTSAAVAENDTGLSPSGTFPLVKEKTTITALIGWSSQTDLNENWNTKDYEQKTNVHVDWQIVSSGDFREKRALLLASGDLPEVFVNGYNQFTAADEMMYGSQGSIIPLNDVIEKDSIYLKKILTDNPLYKNIITSADGKIYSLPDINVCYHCNFSQRMYVNVEWLKKLNIQMPTNIDEFEKMLIAFKEKDPNGNGKADEMPLVTTIDGWHYQLDGFLMNAFVYCDGDTHLAINNGKIEMTAIKPEYKEGLKYLNKLYKEKLISPQSFTTNASSMEKLNESGDRTVIGSVIGGANYIFAGGPAVSERWKEYDILPPIKGMSGFVTTPNYTATRDVTPGYFAISNKAKDPSLVMRWVDWLYSDEGTLWHDENGGREGIEYRKANADELDLNGKPATYAQLKVRKPEDNVVWEQYLPSNRNKVFRECWASPQDWRSDDPQAQGTQYFQGTKSYEAVAPKADLSLPNLFVSSDKISDFTRIKTGIDDYIKESVTKFITGNMDVEKDWDSYVEKMNNIGLKEYLDMCQQAYDSKFKK
jgi:putative aldouronate transport system substrate-binding protein